MRTLPELDITAFMPEILDIIRCLPETTVSRDSSRMCIGKVEVVQDGDRMLLWAAAYDEIVQLLERIQPLLFPQPEKQQQRWWEYLMMLCKD